MIFLVILSLIFVYCLVSTAPKRSIKATWKIIKFMIGLTWRVIKLPFSIIFYFMKKWDQKKKLERMEMEKIEKQKRKLQLKLQILRGDKAK